MGNRFLPCSIRLLTALQRRKLLLSAALSMIQRITMKSRGHRNYIVCTHGRINFQTSGKNQKIHVRYAHIKNTKISAKKLFAAYDISRKYIARHAKFHFIRKTFHNKSPCPNPESRFIEIFSSCKKTDFLLINLIIIMTASCIILSYFFLLVKFCFIALFLIYFKLLSYILNFDKIFESKFTARRLPAEE